MCLRSPRWCNRPLLPTIDEDACPLQAAFAGQFPGAVLFDSGSLQQRELLTIEDCVAPDMATGSDIVCPQFGEDIVDDTVTLASASSTSLELIVGKSPLLTLLESLSNTVVNRHEAARVPYRSYCPPYSATQLQAGRERAQSTLHKLRLALNKDAFPTMASNAILVNADQTDAGQPIAVFGPQTGYFSPQLLMEFSQQGGGINNRGVAFAGVPYVIIGRGIDHAWSATSAGDDIIDIRALRLCEPNGGAPTRASTSYLYNGVCMPMLQRRDEWTAETNATTPASANHIRRVLDMALGQSSTPYRQLRCAGSSELEDCRAALVASLQQTIAQLGSDRQQWASNLKQDDAINHTAFGLADPPYSHWQNRPTWQQVVQPTQDVLQ